MADCPAAPNTGITSEDTTPATWAPPEAPEPEPEPDEPVPTPGAIGSETLGEGAIGAIDPVPWCPAAEDAG